MKNQPKNVETRYFVRVQESAGFVDEDTERFLWHYKNRSGGAEVPSLQAKNFLRVSMILLAEDRWYSAIRWV